MLSKIPYANLSCYHNIRDNDTDLPASALRAVLGGNPRKVNF